MKRDLKHHLQDWKNSPKRKPILLRGARQVGKSYLAREFGKEFEYYLELNFEYTPQLCSIFEKDLDPQRIVRDLSLFTGSEIVPGKTLLFLDEIQECPQSLKSLRYFYEKLPELHVIAAGSLIDFILEDVGLPVGRIKPLYLYPFSFMEFLDVTGHASLRRDIESIDQIRALPEFLHQKLLDLLGEYMAVGGMPEAVQTWITTGDLKKCADIHQTLIDTYRQDFSKYARKSDQKYVDIVFNSIPRLLGKKFVYSSVSPDLRTRELRPALDLLAKAGVAHVIYHSSANGLPLGAEVNPQISKIIFLDIALAQTVLGLDHGQWILNPMESIVNRGPVTEAFVGQELLAYSSPQRKSSLHYWLREKSGSQAEVDYVMELEGKIIPIEVKSGKAGILKSLQLFLQTKDTSPFGLQFSPNSYSIDKKRRIIGVPLYGISAASHQELDLVTG